jgi:carboxylate-amine ligase
MDAQQLRAAFDAPAPFTVGLEEEVMLLEPATLDLAPRAAEVLDALGGDPRYKQELPAAQLELVLPPVRTVAEAIADLRAARANLVRASDGLVRLAAAGVHPFAAPEGVLNSGERYDHTRLEYGRIAHRQLVFALQVHVAIGGAERALAVYNALRGYLPELAALAANAPFHAGEDTGLQSVRPKIAEQLPRQGVPPRLESWEAYADALSWFHTPTTWWWELRPHPTHGTLELRVPDAQTTVEEAAAIAAVAHALVVWLAERHEAGEPLLAPPSWGIAENRWSACRYGVEGELTDLRTGARTPTRERLAGLLDDIAPTAARLGCAAELAGARDLIGENGAMRQRAVAAGGDLRGLVEWLAARFA